MDTQFLYVEAKELLAKYNDQRKKYIDVIAEVTLKEIDLDSTKAKVTMKYEAEKISKTALKEIVAGHEAVLNAKHELLKQKTNKEATAETMKYLEMEYQLRKKMMECIIKEQQYLGG